MTDNKARLWQTDWNSDTKYKCEYCNKLDYTDYYCGGCKKCCDEILDMPLDQLLGESDE